MTFAEQQAKLRSLAETVGFGASWRNLNSSIAFEMAKIEEHKKNSKVEEWLEIAVILESRNK